MIFPIFIFTKNKDVFSNTFITSLYIGSVIGNNTTIKEKGNTIIETSGTKNKLYIVLSMFI